MSGEVIGRANGLCGERPDREVEENIGAGIFEHRNLRFDHLVRNLVNNLLDDQGRGLVTEAIVHTRDIFVSGIVIRVEQADLRARLVLQNVLGIGEALVSIRGEKSHRPGKVRRVVEGRGTGLYEKLRDFVLVHVGADCQIAFRSDGTEDQQDLVLFHQLAREIDCLLHLGGVVYADEVDLAPVDSPFKEMDRR